METALGLPGEQGIERNRVLDLYGVHPQAGCDGLDSGSVNAAKLHLHRMGNIHQAEAVTRKRRDKTLHRDGFGSARRQIQD